MKKIGLIGGTGPESTILYYKELNYKIDRATNGKSMPEICIESVDFRKAWELVSKQQHDELALYISKKVNNLANSGAEVITLTAATMHIVFDKIQNNTKNSLVSIPKAVCDEVLKRGYKRVGLLGTIFTMENNYMKKDLYNAGVNVIIPDKDDRDLIAKRIYEELEMGIVKKTTLQEFNQIIQKMINKHNIEAIILGCTELPLLLNDDNCLLPCLDSVAIHIEKIIKLALE